MYPISESTPLATMDGTLEAPASAGQELLYLLDQLEGDSTAYNISAALRFHARLDPRLLQHAMEAIAHRHEILRTHFEERKGVLVQVIRPQALVPWQTVDLQHVAPEERDGELQAALDAFASLPFELGTGPLLRCRTYIIGPADHVLQFVAHHCVFDGWSHGVLMRELLQIYRSLEQGVAPELAPLPLQFRDFVARQKGRLQGEELVRLRAFWSKQLEELPPCLEFPTDHTRPSVQSHRGDVVNTLLPLELAAGLQSAGAKVGATLFMTLLAALDVLLFRYGGQEDIPVGTPIAGRDAPEYLPLVGFFTNTLVMRCRIDPRATFQEFLEHVKWVALDAYEHCELPFAQVLDLLKRTWSPSYSPVYQVMFAMQSFPRASGSGELNPVPLVHTLRRAKFDLSLEVAPLSRGLWCSMEYATDLFDRDTIERLLASFEVLLRSIVADPTCRIAELPLLSPRERQLILTQFSNGPRA